MGSTYYVSHHASASDGNGGTNPTTDSWATLGYALGAVSSNDRIILVGDGTHVMSATVTANTRCGVWGSNSSGVIDGTQVTVQAASGITGSGPMLDTNTSGFTFGFIKFDGSTYIPDVVSHHDGVVYLCCEFTGGTDNTIENFSGARKGHMVFCIMDGCGTDSTDKAMAARKMTCYRCVARDNSGRGYGGGEMECFACVAHDNGESGFNIAGSAASSFLIDCVSDNNAVDGFAPGDAGSSAPVCITCVATRNGEYGFSKGSTGGNTTVAYRCFYGTSTWANTSGAFRGGSYDITYQVDTQSGDPDFADPNASVSAENDYTPGASSDLLGVGMEMSFPWNDVAVGDQMDIGPIQRHAVAGGASFASGPLVNHPTIQALVNAGLIR